MRLYGADGKVVIHSDDGETYFDPFGEVFVPSPRAILGLPNLDRAYKYAQLSVENITQE